MKVKTGAPPFKIVPNETVRSLSAMLEQPISRAVAIPMGRTYSLNCLLVRGSGLHLGRNENRTAQKVVRVFENVVTVSGNAKRVLKSHLVTRMIDDDTQYQNKSVRHVRSRLSVRSRNVCVAVTDMSGGW